jgi:hypothetical protein
MKTLSTTSFGVMTLIRTTIMIKILRTTPITIMAHRMKNTKSLGIMALSQVTLRIKILGTTLLSITSLRVMLLA